MLTRPNQEGLGCDPPKRLRVGFRDVVRRSELLPSGLGSSSDRGEFFERCERTSMEETLPKSAAAKPLILFVDDDPMLLNSTRRRLMSLTQSWDLRFAESGQQALSIMDTVEPAVVVSDMRMPGMNGLELLTEVERRYPLAIRIILSGQTERDQLAETQVIAHEILQKPCEAEQVKIVVGHCLAIRKRLRQVEIERTILERAGIPISATSLRNILAFLLDPDTNREQLVSQMGQDHRVAQFVLSRISETMPRADTDVTEDVARSPLERTIQCMGIFRVKVAYCFVKLCIRILDTLEDPLFLEVIDSGLQLGARVLETAARKGKPNRFAEECYVAAVFQEIGKLVLFQCFGTGYLEGIALAKQGEVKLSEWEMQRYRCTHAEIGAYLLMQWSFSPHIVESVCSHDDQQLSTPESLRSVVAFVREVALSER
jgi:CheY-like chemotaxis protein